MQNKITLRRKRDQGTAIIVESENRASGIRG
jgi:hypothetical protein